MALSEVQQFSAAIAASRHILIVFKKEHSIDAIASASALRELLIGMKKRVDIVCDDFKAPKSLSFLPVVQEVAPTVTQLQKLIISLRARPEMIEDFSYTFEDGALKVFITPASPGLRATDVSTTQSSYKYDLIITLDTADLQSLGSVYAALPSFFYDTTIINIDHQPENERYGQINIIDVNAVATTEVLYRLFSQLSDVVLTPSIATALLAGLIVETKSFKTANVTPRTLEVAGKLMELDADREAVIKSLYRSRSLGTMRLWGRVLTRLKSDLDTAIVWSIITESDFIEASATTSDVEGVLDELLGFVPGVEIALLLYSHQGAVHGLIQSNKNQNVLSLVQSYTPTGSRQRARFTTAKSTLQDVEKDIITAIRRAFGQKND